MVEFPKSATWRRGRRGERERESWGEESRNTFRDHSVA
jgi:hypothetical protein